ncbi:hypothetical protein BD769DRAFT_1393073 [Suillus cothurnatus]|nr:hypothetical protein BD769DRAFT_1393073 [Suillus cothurnatus]
MAIGVATSKQVDAFRDETYGDWEGMVHPSGVMYYFTWKTKTYTRTDIKRRLQEDAWFLVVEPIAKQDGDHYEYYCVDTSQHVVAWFDAFDASLLFQECAFAREWNHKYSNPAESHLSSNDFMTEQGVAFCGRIWSILRHHQFLNYYGLPEARLMRSHSVEGVKRKRTLPLLLATAAMFGVPALVLEHIENIHVDGIVNSLDIRQFVDRFNDDNVKHSTLVRAFLHIEIRKLCVAARHFGEKMKSLEFASQNLNDNRTRVAIIYSAPSFLRTTRISRRNICNPRSFFNDDSVVHDRRDYPRRFLLLVYTGTEHASLHKFVNIDTRLFGTKPSSVHSRVVLPSLLRSLKYLRLTVFKQIFQFLLLPSLAIQVYGTCSASDPGLYGL